MISKGHHALRIVEEPDFKKLIEDVSNCPGYKLPTRKTLSNVLLPNIHSELIANVKEKIASASGVCLTTDGWTSLTNESYIAVTAHFIDKSNMELSSHMLACEAFGERHTSLNLCSFLQSVAADWKILDKITAIASDNAANIVSAIKLGNWRHIPCFAHTLNIIVQKALGPIDSVRVKAKAIVECFNRSSSGFKKLKEINSQLNLPDLKLTQDVPTRWNSTYKMFQRLSILKDGVMVVISLLRPELVLTQAEWEIIDGVLPVLKPFSEITTEISAEKNVTLSNVIIMATLLHQSIAKAIPKDDFLRAVVEKLKEQLTVRFGDLENNILYAESTILDPRFKKRGFRSDECYEKTVAALQCKIAQTGLVDNVADDLSSQIETVKTSPTKSGIWDEYDKQYNQITKPSCNTAAAIREVDKYLAEENINRKQDPLIWWTQRKNVYPRLYEYALKRLCLVATSVPCERLFSAAGEIVRKRRTLLTPNKVESLMFLHNNM
ncbi:zinc finger BED domain-containing protein 1-like [Drosophila miranda]|uniref:zinc finger BED domain-containing protein 1-like n=1 Tax=Drosophila miranda TaxID=7229 RepID=UPI00143F9293|nr:zinc finger BED domain-containing protein 1-like [Drosophila miranda]